MVFNARIPSSIDIPAPCNHKLWAEDMEYLRGLIRTERNYRSVNLGIDISRYYESATLLVDLIEYLGVIPKLTFDTVDLTVVTDNTFNYSSVIASGHYRKGTGIFKQLGVNEMSTKITIVTVYTNETPVKNGVFVVRVGDPNISTSWRYLVLNNSIGYNEVAFKDFGEGNILFRNPKGIYIPASEILKYGENFPAPSEYVYLMQRNIDAVAAAQIERIKKAATKK